MSTNPFESLPPAPDDLWPKVSSTILPPGAGVGSFSGSLADMAEIRTGNPSGMQIRRMRRQGGHATCEPAFSQAICAASSCAFRPGSMRISRPPLHFYEELHRGGAGNVLSHFLPRRK